MYFPRETRAASDVRDILDKLKIKAVAKIREYCLLKINQFKKPLANYQIPQNAMLRFKFYFRFLQVIFGFVANIGPFFQIWADPHLTRPGVTIRPRPHYKDLEFIFSLAI